MGAGHFLLNGVKPPGWAIQWSRSGVFIQESKAEPLRGLGLIPTEFE